ncbi:hypothetical protein BD0024_09230 [Helicobacter pylori]|uniref:hypothetical protein n=1 Tax=Helicobacter pylori TaxID=210 RepID=UPI0036F3ADD4
MILPLSHQERLNGNDYFKNSAKSGIFWVRLGIDFKEKERKEFNEKRQFSGSFRIVTSEWGVLYGSS